MINRAASLPLFAVFSVGSLNALQTYPVPFEIAASPLYSAIWLLSIGCGAYAVGRIFLHALRTGIAHLRTLAGMLAAFLMAVVCSYCTELNHLGAVDENISRIATMVFLCFIPILAPGIAETGTDLPRKQRLSRVFTVCGIAMLLHYLVTGITFYAFEFRVGGARYFDGHRVLPAFALYVLLTLASVYTGLVFLAARERFSESGRKALRRVAFCCIAFAPPMLAVDELRFLIPPLWNMYPREDLFVLPVFFAAVCVAVNGYARTYALPSKSSECPADIWLPSVSFVFPIGLSLREREVAELLSRGLAYKEIAYRLGISMGTTQSHVAGVYRKLGVNCKEDLMLLYSRPKTPESGR